MKLTAKEAAEARARALAYEANMAVEGVVLTPEGRALADYVDANRIGYEESRKLIIDDLGKRGLIPAIVVESDIAAE